MTVVRTAARAMLAAIFVSSGAESVLNPDRVAGKAKRLTDRVTPMIEKSSLNAPTDTATLVQINGAAQVLGGLMMLTPAHRVGAVTLAATLVPTTAAGHAFWEIDEPGDRTQQRIHFLKNVAIMGGLLLAAMDTGGKPGVRWRAQHLADTTTKSVRRAARNTRSKAEVARKAARYARRLPS
jgi:uncharacterized membrane protein YphA (DoxX/SURF4 family)